MVENLENIKFSLDAQLDFMFSTCSSFFVVYLLEGFRFLYIFGNPGLLWGVQDNKDIQKILIFWSLQRSSNWKIVLILIILTACLQHAYIKSLFIRDIRIHAYKVCCVSSLKKAKSQYVLTSYFVVVRVVLSMLSKL